MNRDLSYDSQSGTCPEHIPHQHHSASRHCCKRNKLFIFNFKGQEVAFCVQRKKLAADLVKLQYCYEEKPRGRDTPYSREGDVS